MGRNRSVVYPLIYSLQFQEQQTGSVYVLPADVIQVFYPQMMFTGAASFLHATQCNICGSFIPASRPWYRNLWSQDRYPPYCRLQHTLPLLQAFTLRFHNGGLWAIWAEERIQGFTCVFTFRIFLLQNLPRCFEKEEYHSCRLKMEKTDIGFPSWMAAFLLRVLLHCAISILEATSNVCTCGISQAKGVPCQLSLYHCISSFRMNPSGTSYEGKRLQAKETKATGKWKKQTLLRLVFHFFVSNRFNQVSVTVDFWFQLYILAAGRKHIDAAKLKQEKLKVTPKVWMPCGPQICRMLQEEAF